ncbi:MAG: hypothetical protein HKN47_08510 [Pirellulaceae bacterium]|nr:hypothetical protein [Pirellulaceae bacterium]
MNAITLLTVLFVPLLFIGLVIAACRSSHPTRLVCQLLATITAIPLLGAFAFGYLASAEVSGTERLVFQILYASLGILACAGVAFAWLPKRQRNPQVPAEHPTGESPGSETAASETPASGTPASERSSSDHSSS